MTTKELKELYLSHTGGVQAWRLQHLVSGLTKNILLPTYNDQLTPDQAGLFIWVVAVCPYSHYSRVAKWISDQMSRQMEAYKAGAIDELPKLPNHVIGEGIRTGAGENIYIHNQTGAIFKYEGTKMKILSNYSCIDARLINFPILDVQIIPGSFLKRLHKDIKQPVTA